MLASRFRSVTRLIGSKSSVVAASNRVAKAVAVAPIFDVSSSTLSSSHRFISTDQEKHFQDLGALDDRGLTIFNTLHELQVNSSLVFKENELFGTYAEKSKSYDYITYDEYSERVNKCRTLLKDLGKDGDRTRSPCIRLRISNLFNFCCIPVIFIL